MRVPPKVGAVGEAPKIPSSAMASPGACSEKKCDCSTWSWRRSSTVMPGLPATTTSVHCRSWSASAHPVTMDPKLCATTVSDWCGPRSSQPTNAARSLPAATRFSAHSIDLSAADNRLAGL